MKRIIPPKHLDAIAKEVWKQVAPLVGPDEKTTDILCLFCDGVSQYRHAAMEIEKHGKVQVSSSGIMRMSPWVPIQKQAFDQIMKSGRALGLEPKNKPVLPDELDNFLEGK